MHSCLCGSLLSPGQEPHNGTADAHELPKHCKRKDRIRAVSFLRFRVEIVSIPTQRALEHEEISFLKPFIGSLIPSQLPRTPWWKHTGSWVVSAMTGLCKGSQRSAEEERFRQTPGRSCLPGLTPEEDTGRFSLQQEQLTQNLDVSENMTCSQNKPFRVAGVERVKGE